MDPGLKPYLLQPTGASIESLLKTIDSKVDAINRMSNMTGVRTKITQAMSGIALETEFQLLNAKLSSKADLLELAEEQNSHILLSETYLLKAELSALQGDIKSARHCFGRAQMIAEEKGLHKLALSISREYDAFVDKIGQSSDTDEKSDQEPLELGKVTNLLDRMSTQSIAAVSDPPAIEDSIMLLIITEGGITIFSHFFKSKGVIKGPLVGSFLSAIEAFSKEVFSSSIERLTLGDHRLIINISENLTFAYVYLGESYTAIKRLKKFILMLQMNSDLWKALKNKVNTGMLLTSDEEAIILNAVQNTF